MSSMMERMGLEGSPPFLMISETYRYCSKLCSRQFDIIIPEVAIATLSAFAYDLL
jgi:hypothetical protein